MSLWLPSTHARSIARSQPAMSHRPVVLTPCQICQFCYNNIKTTMNGLCPACRRPYDDSTIEWKTISPEEWVPAPSQPKLV